MQFVFPDLFFFKKRRWCEQPLQSPYCNWGTGEAGARKDAQHSKLAENAVTKGLDLNKKEHGTSIREVIQHLDYFFSHFWDSGNWEKLQGQKTPHIYLMPIPTGFGGGGEAKGLRFDLRMGFLSLHICFSSENKPFFLQKGRWRLGNKRWDLLRGKEIAGIWQQSLTVYMRKIGQVGWH